MMPAAHSFLPRFATCSTLSLLLCACQPGTTTPVHASPDVSPQRIVFDADNPQLQVFHSTAVDAHSQPQISLPGRLHWDAARTAYLRALAPGQVSRIEVELGDRVQRGQVLAWVNSADIGGLQADHARSRAALQQATRAMERVAELHAAGVASGRELEEAEATLAGAQAENDRTLAGIEAIGAASRVDQRLPLRAPIDGIVVERRLSPGMNVAPDSEAPLVVISDPDQLWLQIDIPEHQAAGIQAGLAIEVESNGHRQHAVLHHVADFIDTERRTIAARAVVDNRARLFKAGQLVRSKVELPSDHGVAIPSRGLLQTGDEQVVFVEEAPGRFRRQPVQAQLLTSGSARITQGLDAGSRIVVEGSLLLLQMTDQALIGASRADAGGWGAP